MLWKDTIVAPATAPGVAAVAVLRISGPDAKAVLRRVFRPLGGGYLKHRALCYGDLYHGDTHVDRCMAVYFRAPHSYTGEESAELHLHGGALVVRNALQAVLQAGARPAEPGEFTRRAFLNGKLDLSQAEAVMDVIAAQAQGAEHIALQQLRGRVFDAIAALQGELTTLLAQIEVHADYPEEDLEDQTAQAGIDALGQMQTRLQGLLAHARAGRALREGIRIAIVGVPNAGKSSLLNALCGQDRAIVSDIPGTTRDMLDVQVAVRGLAVTLVDTAGIRTSDDVVEQMGVQRARAALQSADMALLVVDAQRGFAAADEEIYNLCGHVPTLVIYNKMDVATQPPQALRDRLPQANILPLCAQNGDGLEALLDEIYALGTGGVQAQSVELSNARHIHAAQEALDAMAMARQALQAGYPLDVATVDIRRAWRLLGEITGETADAAIIDEIFSRFCLGK